MTPLILGVTLVALLLAYANGANDNIKGAATLFGSGTAPYRRTLTFATVATALGAVSALLLGRALLVAFTGKGLVPPDVVAAPAFRLSVGLGAGITVLLATFVGLPISTTHALIGGLVGAGLTMGGMVHFGRLGKAFLLPLALGPVIAVAGAALLYPILRGLGRRMVGSADGTLTLDLDRSCPSDDPACCDPARAGEAGGVALPVLRVVPDAGPVALTASRSVRLRALLDGAHTLSAGAVCYARGLNDAPKVAAVMFLAGGLAPTSGLAIVAGIMVVGGLFHSRKIADTMGRQITTLDAGQGFTANAVTAALVIGASRLGMPMSTTHVSCGSLFGIGAATRQGRVRTIARILLAWVVTLPMAGAIAAAAAWALETLGR